MTAIPGSNARKIFALASVPSSKLTNMLHTSGGAVFGSHNADAGQGKALLTS